MAFMNNAAVDIHTQTSNCFSGILSVHNSEFCITFAELFQLPFFFFKAGSHCEPVADLEFTDAPISIC